MFEKIKDFLFDIRDIVIVIIIIAVLVFSVTWKIDDTMNIDLNKELTIGEPTTEATTEPTTFTTPSTTASTTTTTEPTTEAFEWVNFVVSEGEYGQDIAKNLLEKGLIDDTHAFLVRANELGVDTKLHTGEYNFKTTDDLDTIINLLAGGSREE